MAPYGQKTITMASTVNGTDTTKNYFSIINNPDGSLGYVIDAGMDTQHSVFSLPTTNGLLPLIPPAYDAILKINANSVSIPSLIIPQGHEDSLNIADNSSGVRVTGLFGDGPSSGLRVITIKGGCSMITLAGIIMHHGTSYWDGDISIDDWIDQTYNASKLIDVSGLSMADGSSIKVVKNFRAGTIIYGPNCKLAIIPSIWRTAYWWFKFYVRKILGIKVGQAGPSWLS
jgi:hypothetical protein